jgi:two-component sensor histidine kinase
MDKSKGISHRTLEEAIVDTIRHPLVVLDGEHRVVTASRSFYQTFRTEPAETEGSLFYHLGSGQWDQPRLRQLLAEVIPAHAPMESYEVEYDFPVLGVRVMLLDARKVWIEGNGSLNLLVGIEDVTDRRRLEQQQQDLLRQKDLLLKEMSHRISNSLQIIASILLLKAHSVNSTETRRHLEEAHERVVAIAKVQNHLQPLPFGGAIDAQRYLTSLVESLADSMIEDRGTITLRTEIDAGAFSSEEAVSIGLIVTELIINALKHAFTDATGDEVVVRYQVGDANWRLSVSDNGKGMQRDLTDAPVRAGLGTSIVEALARQLGGRVQTAAESPGTTVSVTGPKRS